MSMTLDEVRRVRGAAARWHGGTTPLLTRLGLPDLPLPLGQAFEGRLLPGAPVFHGPAAAEDIVVGGFAVTQAAVCLASARGVFSGFQQADSEQGAAGAAGAAVPAAGAAVEPARHLVLRTRYTGDIWAGTEVAGHCVLAAGGRLTGRLGAFQLEGTAQPLQDVERRRQLVASHFPELALLLLGEEEGGSGGGRKPAAGWEALVHGLVGSAWYRGVCVLLYPCP